jgi:hypothetical protein
MLRRIDCCVGEELLAKLSTPGFRHDLEQARWLLSLQYLREHFIFRPEGHSASLFHRQKEIHSADCAWAVGDHDRDATARADAEYGLRQRGIAFGIEIGIGLVENHQEWIAIERAGQRYALRLSRRERSRLLGRFAYRIRSAEKRSYRGRRRSLLPPVSRSDRHRVRNG